MQNTGLVLEGGGMRGVFTGGVLQFLMEKDIYLPYVIGVSAGACNGSSYVARQIDRNKIVNIDYIRHPEYMSVKNLVRKGELLGMDFLFNKLPNELVPFDFTTFNQASDEFIVGTTDCMTGEPVYFDKTTYHQDILTIIRASSSLPLMAPIISYQGLSLLDGGIADPIPLLKAEKDDYKKNVVILTRNKGYMKGPQSFSWYLKRKYAPYQGLLRAIARRHQIYNETVSYIEEQEKKGNVFVIRPSEKIEVGRIERNPTKLTRLYDQGYKEASHQYQALMEFLT